MLTNFYKYNHKTPKVEPTDYIEKEEWKKFNKPPISPVKRSLNLKFKPILLDETSGGSPIANQASPVFKKRILNYGSFTQHSPIMPKRIGE